MNTVNLPLALVTVILRRFIDKFRTTQGAVILKTTSPWFMDTSLFKSCMYAYMFCAGLYYTIKHMQRGTIVTLARKCSEGAVTIKDKYVRKGNYLCKNRSSLVKNLVNGRDGQQRALRYMASMTPHETALQPSANATSLRYMASMTPHETALQPSANATSNLDGETVSTPYQNFQLDKTYIDNPYFEPSGIIRNENRYAPFYKQRRNTTGPDITSIIRARSSDFPSRYDTNEISHTDSTELPPVDIETISISDQSKSLLPKTKRKPKQRNCLTLRGRKIVKNDLSFCGDKIVRKTRSGKVYGYQFGGPRCYRKKKV